MGSGTLIQKVRDSSSNTINREVSPGIRSGTVQQILLSMTFLPHSGDGSADGRLRKKLLQKVKYKGFMRFYVE